MSLNVFAWGWSSGYLKPQFWGWESAEALANILTGICRVVHTPEIIWKAVHGAASFKSVRSAFIPNISTSTFIPSVVQQDSIYKAVRGNAVQVSGVPRVQAPISTAGKVSRDSSIPRVYTGGVVPKAVHQIGQGKAVKSP